MKAVYAECPSCFDHYADKTPSRAYTAFTVGMLALTVTAMSYFMMHAM